MKYPSWLNLYSVLLLVGLTWALQSVWNRSYAPYLGWKKIKFWQALFWTLCLQTVAQLAFRIFVRWVG